LGNLARQSWRTAALAMYVIGIAAGN